MANKNISHLSPDFLSLMLSNLSIADLKSLESATPTSTNIRDVSLGSVHPTTESQLNTQMVQFIEEAKKSTKISINVSYNILKYNLM